MMPLLFSVQDRTKAAAATAKSLQSRMTLCDPTDSPPGSPVPGILQARKLEWVAISFSIKKIFNWIFLNCLFGLFVLLCCVWSYHMAYGMSVPQPGIEPVAPELEVQSPNHWDAREVPLAAS